MPGKFRSKRRTKWSDPNLQGREVECSIEGPAFDREGNLYVVDTPFGRIFRITPPEELKAQHLTPEVLPALNDLYQKLADIPWTAEEINGTVRAILEGHKLKLPKIAMPLRVMVAGSTQTPSIDAVLYLIGREEVRARMAVFL